MRLVVTARTAAIFVAALILQAACELEPCKAIGNLFFERHYQVIADTLRSEPIANIMQLTSSFPRLRFNVSMSVASHAPEEDVLVEKLIRVFESAHKNEAGEGKVNALYDSYVPTLGYHRWFRALWTAISTVTKDSDPMFLTSNSKEQTGYLDWHWLAAHASAAARDRVSLLAYFGSRVDLSFMVHGAAWATVTNASAAGLFRFSDDLRSRAQSTPRSGSKPRKPRGGDGAVELLLAPGFSALRKVCPWSALHGDDGPEAAKRSAQQHGAEEQGGEEDYPWLAECLHGLGHGVFMASVESLAAAGKSLSVPEVMRRSAALGSAILNGDGPSTAAILRHGTVATKLSSWMVAADVGSAAHEFERDRDRYGWRDGSAAAWRDGYAALVGAFPASCAAALTPSIPRRWTAAATSAATTAAAATSAAHAGAGPSKSDDDWAVSACLSQGGKYGFRPLGSAECLALARAEATGGVGSLTCATMSGAVGLMGLHGGNVHRALRACRSSYLESLEAAAAYSYSMLHPHYKACVGGERLHE